jgi:hypothetical protein
MYFQYLSHKSDFFHYILTYRILYSQLKSQVKTPPCQRRSFPTIHSCNSPICPTGQPCTNNLRRINQNRLASFSLPNHYFLHSRFLAACHSRSHSAALFPIVESSDPIGSKFGAKSARLFFLRKLWTGD